MDVVSDAPAYATKTRWIAPKLIEAVSRMVPAADVRSVHVLVPSGHTRTAAGSLAVGDDSARRARPAAPVKTRETASVGYRRAPEAHRAVAAPRQEDPALAAVVLRQEQARRDLTAIVFPGIEQNQEGAAPQSLEDICAQQRQANDAVRIAAILRAQAERAGRPLPTTAPALC
ncbi:hypothetical protein [Streptomyces sp. NPDC002057]|uniref:hypothetical protein n=1 Tax=Streptomyces sp. NPDC002057 TaxID=3154664 RepID=UPI00331F8C04